MSSTVQLALAAVAFMALGGGIVWRLASAFDREFPVKPNTTAAGSASTEAASQ